MPNEFETPDTDNEALARRMERSAAQIEKFATDFRKGGIERTLTKALRRNQKEMERQLSSLLRETLLSALGGGFGGGGGRSRGLASLIGSFIPGFARGGIISGRSIIGHGGGVGAGEAGPEVILPLRKGRDGRLGVVAASQDGGKGRGADTSPRRVEVTIVGDSSASASVPDDAFREAVAGAVADALDGAIDERIALHLRSGGLLDGGRGWQQ